MKALHISFLPKSQVSGLAALCRVGGVGGSNEWHFSTRMGDEGQYGTGNSGGTTGRSGWGWGRVAPDAAGIRISACCCYHGYRDMQANRRCQTDNSEGQLETLGEGR